jgi:hypothetical protein
MSLHHGLLLFLSEAKNRGGCRVILQQVVLIRSILILDRRYGESAGTATTCAVSHRA